MDSTKVNSWGHKRAQPTQQGLNNDQSCYTGSWSSDIVHLLIKTTTRVQLFLTKRIYAIAAKHRRHPLLFWFGFIL